jgi:hypothetical protein
MANYDPAYEYKSNPNYIEFSKQKEELKKKYPPRIFERESTSGRTNKHIKKVYKDYLDNDRKLHLEYLKELADLIFEQNGYFQQLTWDMMAEVDKLEMERNARGRKKSGQSSEYSW